MSNSKNPAPNTDNSEQKVIKGMYGLQSSVAPTKREKPACKTKGKK